jgi:enoyl-CoA hydratase/carnithine racemase
MLGPLVRRFVATSSSTTSAFRTLVGTLPPPSPSSHVTYSLSSSNIAKITIDSALTKNALTPHMMLDLEDCVSQLQRDEPSFLILTGANGAFCSGADINVASSTIMPEDGSTEGGRLMAEHMNGIAASIRSLPRTVTFACIDGAAFGGGAELAMSCDFRVAAPSSKLRFVQTTMGVTTGWGGGRSLVDAVGKRTALKLLCFSEVVVAEAGVRMGLFDWVCSADEKTADFVELKIREGELHDNPVVPSWKDVINARTSDEEVDVFTRHWNGGKHREMFAKFVPKRR